MASDQESTKSGSKPMQQGGRAEERDASKHQPPAGVQPIEPEDPRLVGGNKEDQHRALEDNVKGESEEHPDSTGGLHATGSFTDDSAKRK